VGTYHVLLFLHLLGAFLFVAGAASAAVLQLAAMRRERLDEIAVLLGAIRGAVVLLAVGAVLVFVFGIWLAEHIGYGLAEGWVLASFLLFVGSLVLGALGGRRDRHTRELVEGGSADSAAVRARLRNPVTLALNYGSAALLQLAPGRRERLLRRRQRPVRQELGQPAHLVELRHPLRRRSHQRRLVLTPRSPRESLRRVGTAHHAFRWDRWGVPTLRRGLRDPDQFGKPHQSDQFQTS